MRMAGHIPHPTFNISIFALENHYSVMFQAGPMEQSYKISKDAVNGVEGVKQWVDQALCDKVHDIFNNMYTEFKSCQERYDEKYS